MAGALRWIKMQRNEFMDNVPPLDKTVMPKNGILNRVNSIVEMSTALDSCWGCSWLLGLIVSRLPCLIKLMALAVYYSIVEIQILLECLGRLYQLDCLELYWFIDRTD